MDIRILITFMASVLFLGGYSPAEACRCITSHPQTVFCHAGAVLQIKFGKPATQSSEKGIEVKVTEIWKGSEKCKAMSFVTTMSGTSCEFAVPTENMHKEYIVAVTTGADCKMSLSQCSYVKPMSTMPREQMAGMRKAYAEGCGCEITSCAQAPCTPDPSQCILEGGDAGDKQQNMMCAPDGKGMCKWKKM